MEIKAVMCDLDGTLLSKGGEVMPLTLEMIKKLKEKGILFGLCTGRDVHSVKDLLKEWKLDGLVDAIVGCGGAEIADLSLNVEKSSFPLKGELIWEIIRHYEDLDVNFAIPWQGELIAPREDELIQKLSQADHLPYRIVDFNEFLKQERPKLMIICDPQYMDTVIARSQTFSSPDYKSAGLITASILFEYMDPRISKTYGLEEVMKLHGWGLENLCTFGDADNDYDMTLNAGMGVVMANGSDKTKGAADFITREDNNHDGIGHFIAEVLLEKLA